MLSKARQTHLFAKFTTCWLLWRYFWEPFDHGEAQTIDAGLQASSDSAGGDATPALEKDEREPSNKLLLTAMTSLCSEIKTIKPKLCATLDTHTLEISTTIRGEISSLNQCVQASISDIKSDMAKHDQTTLTPSPLSRPPWSVCLQS